MLSWRPPFAMNLRRQSGAAFMPAPLQSTDVGLCSTQLEKEKAETSSGLRRRSRWVLARGEGAFSGELEGDGCWRARKEVAVVGLQLAERWTIEGKSFGAFARQKQCTQDQPKNDSKRSKARRKELAVGDQRLGWSRLGTNQNGTVGRLDWPTEEEMKCY